jgi:hypothetical protein
VNYCKVWRSQSLRGIQKVRATSPLLSPFRMFTMATDTFRVSANVKTSLGNDMAVSL